MSIFELDIEQGSARKSCLLNTELDKVAGYPL